MWFSTNLEYFFNAKKIDFLIFFIFEIEFGIKLTHYLVYYY